MTNFEKIYQNHKNWLMKLVAKCMPVIDDCPVSVCSECAFRRHGTLEDDKPFSYYCVNLENKTDEDFLKWLSEEVKE